MLQLRNLIWRLSNQGTGLREGMSQECIHQLSPNPLYKILPHVRSGRSYCYVMHMIQSLKKYLGSHKRSESAKRKYFNSFENISC